MMTDVSTRRWGAAAVVLGLVAALVLMTPGSAGAEVTGGCEGSADFTADSVGPYTPDNDTRDNPIIVPKADGNQANWQGSVPGPNLDFEGKVEIRLGPAWIEVADWGNPDHDGSNVNDERSDSGVYDMDDLWDVIPKNIAQGIYEARASHKASGVDCDANFFVKFEGNALSSPIAIGALVLLALAAAMLILAGRRTGSLGFFAGKPVLGFISGLLGGWFLAVLLQQFSVWPLDNLTVIVIPVGTAIIGIIIAKVAPFGGGGGSSPLGDLGPPDGGGEIFADGFESGDTSAWTDD